MSLREIEDSASGLKLTTVYYAALTTWWTCFPQDLYTMPDSGLPCDPRRSPLFQADLDAFLAVAKRNVEHYGAGGLKALEAAFHGNIILADSGWPTSLEKWDSVNSFLGL